MSPGELDLLLAVDEAFGVQLGFAVRVAGYSDAGFFEFAFGVAHACLIRLVSVAQGALGFGQRHGCDPT